MKVVLLSLLVIFLGVNSFAGNVRFLFTGQTIDSYDRAIETVPVKKVRMVIGQPQYGENRVIVETAKGTCLVGHGFAEKNKLSLREIQNILTEDKDAVLRCSELTTDPMLRGGSASAVSLETSK